MSNITERLTKILEDKLRLNTKVDDFWDTSFSNSGLDSLDVIEIIMEIEKEFNISIDEDLLTTDSNFINLEHIIEDQLKMKVL